MGSRSPKHARCERDWWNWLNGKGRRHAIRRNKIKRQDRYLKRARFTAEDLLQFTIEGLAQGKSISPESSMGGLLDIHPEAFRFLRRWGRIYQNHEWKKPPLWGEPVRKKCFLNSASLAERQRRHFKKRKNLVRSVRHLRQLVYVEGVVYGPLVNPMLHAWNVQGINGRVAIDWTFYAFNHVVRYFGIPFSIEEHQRLCKVSSRNTKAMTFFHRKYFTPRMRTEMIKILLARKRAGKKMPRRAKQKKTKSRKTRGSFYLSFLVGGSGHSASCQAFASSFDAGRIFLIALAGAIGKWRELSKSSASQSSSSTPSHFSGL